MLVREECRRLTDDSLGTEHIILGLMGQGTGSIATKALESIGIKLKHVSDIDHLAFEFTRPGIRTLVRSFEEAGRLGHNYIGPEHLFLGLILEEVDDEPLKLALRCDTSRVQQAYRDRLGSGNDRSSRAIVCGRNYSNFENFERAL
ncbi:hypothetical protein V6N13_004129 [Hibiscus sabdariffa]|uniref:Clp R domain-containing protein n=1 Tax=Hibiscus sabdariffa TaxID=183260 RepID=A0ABR2RXK9_9ROSI